ncbi:hypothetical protein BD31_I1651 [Candidatus Nitrosopumilus salaria BD31]|uniref:Uncharacterized protein n=1 Tax=Candidatus Nitrosopumilus salarius BD31 TaxID=859350 RepID=I3D140_9ARCH|nr:hypothetical protein [Candidatus Nitrosopumilus salaria]EIJ65433.1 hypothetical protein BD31_I1651 [Candidatus Nitrosopumilus salaria BD31]
MTYDEICPICSKSKDQHNTEDRDRCNLELVKQGIMRYCGLCGLTKPAEGFRDRCGKCGETYSFTNE